MNSPLTNSSTCPKSPTAKLMGFALLATGMWLLLTGSWNLGKAQLSQYLLEKSWETLQDQNQFTEIKPWSGADTFPVAKISVKHLKWSAVVLHGVTGEALAFGPGHLSTSARPGLRGNSVIAGHRDTHFSILEKLDIGDVVTIERPEGLAVDFEIENIRVVNESEVSVLESGERTELTLITCYPFDAITAGGPLRYVITAIARFETSTATSAISRAIFEPSKRRGEAI